MNGGGVGPGVAGFVSLSQGAQPRPTKGIVVGRTVRDCTLAVTGREAISRRASVKWDTGRVASTALLPSAWRAGLRGAVRGLHVADVDLAAGDVVGAAVERE